jgi:hypothetical protein
MSGRLAIERLLDGVVHTLTTAVLPAVASRFARGQLYAAVDVLRNLRDRVEVKASLLEAEATSASEALAALIAVLREGGVPGAVAAVEDAVAAAPSAPAERVAALRAAIVLALDVLEAVPPPLAARARRPLDTHLAAQAMRDLAVLKPSLLGEISRG